MGYTKRVVERQLDDALAVSGAVLIEGPRGCGKTSTGMQRAASVVRFDTDEQARQLARVAPQVLLAGDNPRLIDEWQLVDSIWNQVRLTVDSRQEKGTFILTGSAASTDEKTKHSGAARIMRLKMRPMTLFETGFSNGAVSLEQLLTGEGDFATTNKISFEALIDEICRGGWPAYLGLEVSKVLPALRSYIADLERTDFTLLDGRRKSAATVKRVLKALARNVGSDISIAKLTEEITLQEPVQIKSETVGDYVGVLTSLMVVENLQPWSTHLRSKDRVLGADKRYFVDPSLAVAILGASPASLLKDLNTLGFLFENLVIRDLRVFAESFGADVAQYRDSSGLEVDAIVTSPSGDWAAFEVKLGPAAIDAAAANLLKFKKRVDSAKCGEPKRLAVITTGDYSYVREDGVAVISIGTLGP
jgi:hypothetical protein